MILGQLDADSTFGILFFGIIAIAVVLYCLINAVAEIRVVRYKSKRPINHVIRPCDREHVHQDDDEDAEKDNIISMTKDEKGLT